jgi:hypothetical protein
VAVEPDVVKALVWVNQPTTMYFDRETGYDTKGVDYGRLVPEEER